MKDIFAITFTFLSKFGYLLPLFYIHYSRRLCYLHGVCSFSRSFEPNLKKPKALPVLVLMVWIMSHTEVRPVALDMHRVAAFVVPSFNCEHLVSWSHWSEQNLMHNGLVCVSPWSSQCCLSFLRLKPVFTAPVPNLYLLFLLCKCETWVKKSVPSPLATPLHSLRPLE